MLYCYDKYLPFEYSHKEMAVCKEKNNGILYDKEQNEFLDFLGNKVNIEGKKIFPRTGSAQIYDMNKKIIEKGGIPILSDEEITKIDNWPNYYQTIRKTKIVKGKDLIDEMVVERIESVYGNKIFIKTKEKDFNGVIPISILKDKECTFYKGLEYHLEDEFIISEVVDVVKDEYGIKEYRCFVINNEIYNISRYTTTILHSIDEPILEKARTIVKSMENTLPGCYVVDLFEYRKDNKTYIDVVEFNSIHSSGLYLYNSVMEKSKDFLHSDIRNLPSEFSDKLNECTVHGYITGSDNIYEFVGYNRFSSDLINIYLDGVTDIGIWRGGIYELNDEVLSSHYHPKKSTNKGYELLEEEIIRSDDDLDDFNEFLSMIENGEISEEEIKKQMEEEYKKLEKYYY